jgi:hypothetical protein
MTKKEQREKVYELFLNDDYENIWNYPEVLDKNMALLFIDCGAEWILLGNLDRFKNLDYKIASKLFKFNNWEINDYLKKNLDKFKLTISQKSELKNFVDENFDNLIAMKEVGVDKQTIFDGYLKYDKFHIIANNLSFFKEILENRWNAKKLIDLSDDFVFVKHINSQFKPSLDDVIDLTDKVFGEYATKKCYEIFTRINNGDKFIINTLKLKDGGKQGLDEVKLLLLNFKNDIVRIGDKKQIKLNNNDRGYLYEIFFSNFKRQKIKKEGDSIEGILSYIDLDLI